MFSVVRSEETPCRGEDGRLGWGFPYEDCAPFGPNYRQTEPEFISRGLPRPLIEPNIVIITIVPRF